MISWLLECKKSAHYENVNNHWQCPKNSTKNSQKIPKILKMYPIRYIPLRGRNPLRACFSNILISKRLLVHFLQGTGAPTWMCLVFSTTWTSRAWFMLKDFWWYQIWYQNQHCSVFCNGLQDVNIVDSGIKFDSSKKSFNMDEAQDY